MGLQWIRYQLLAVALLLSGCNPVTGAYGEFLRETLLSGSGGGADTRVELNPAFRYLRVTQRGRLVYMASGAADVEDNGQVRVWYSASGEVLRIRSGRVVGVTGTFTEWSNVDITGAPAWAALAGAASPMRWVRVRDVMPGYRYGLRDQLSVRPVSPPSDTALVGLEPRDLSWFEEIQLSSDGEPLPPSRYAVDLRAGRAIPVYGEQCFLPAGALCFSWQLWPVDTGGGA